MQLQIYLASPYTDYSNSSKQVMQTRFEEAVKAVAKLTEQDNIVYSPIVQYHNVSQFMEHNKQQDSSFWVLQNNAMLEWCDELWILCIPGWEESEGVEREMEYAKEEGIEIKFVNPTTYEVTEHTGLDTSLGKLYTNYIDIFENVADAYRYIHCGEADLTDSPEKQPRTKKEIVAFKQLLRTYNKDIEYAIARLTTEKDKLAQIIQKLEKDY